VKLDYISNTNITPGDNPETLVRGHDCRRAVVGLFVIGMSKEVTVSILSEDMAA